MTEQGKYTETLDFLDAELRPLVRVGGPVRLEAADLLLSVARARLNAPPPAAAAVQGLVEHAELVLLLSARPAAPDVVNNCVVALARNVLAVHTDAGKAIAREMADVARGAGDQVYYDAKEDR